ncbi:uncharacterized protein LOC144660990 [Oculina patagonica]
MADFDLEVKYSLYTINSKDTETPSVKPWWCRTTLCEQGSLQALEKRLKAKVSDHLRKQNVLDYLVVINVHQKSANGGQKKLKNYKVIDDETWTSCYRDIRQCPKDYELHVELRETQYRAPSTLTTKKQFTKKATCDDTTLLSKLTKTSQNPIDGYKRTPKQEADLQKMKTDVEKTYCTEYAKAEAWNELWIKCICGELFQLNRMRYWKFFGQEKGHWVRCPERRE